ncbi:MAG: hypothetical protein L6E13_10515 [Firmicutes bacterium]|nr:hypothetical protein [Bacillota bacterium]
MLTQVRSVWGYARARWGLFRSDRGASLAEYVLLVGFIAVMVIAGVIAFREVIQDALQRAGDKLSDFGK